MNQKNAKSPRLEKRSVAALNKTATAESRHATLLIMVTTSGITSTIIYTIDPPR